VRRDHENDEQHEHHVDIRHDVHLIDDFTGAAHDVFLGSKVRWVIHRFFIHRLHRLHRFFAEDCGEEEADVGMYSLDELSLFFYPQITQISADFWDFLRIIFSV
jgi:hypothetical protein